ncbi:relaxase/mobilization nuclease domain-containing protein [Palleronia rufa]|uniref:relaxase/mobilization nuclease domain-containing protein n=1 Tax=Palleronia rufa TaxID=1530186 RepID=UPI0039EE85DD
MILKAKERGNAPQLASYLLSMRENEHVELYQMRGFVSDDLKEAFAEAEAIASATKCKKHLFSISLNPPQDQHVSREAFEQAADQIEAKVGLSGHPRAIVFHEKEGRRHAHAVWSRIDSEAMRAKNMGFYKHKLMDVSRDLFLQHGWDMPKGMLDHNLRNPLNFTHAQWQQSKRTDQDPRLIKAAIQHCWKNSDNHESLKNALEDKGFFLAQGDRRAVVTIDVRGETYSLSRMAGVKVKDVRARIGDTKALPSVNQTKQRISDRMTDTLKGYLQEVRAGGKTLPPGIAFKLEQMVARHREERKATWTRHEQRDLREKQARVARLPKWTCRDFVPPQVLV